jgi:hypothetical protein
MFSRYGLSREGVFSSCTDNTGNLKEGNNEAVPGEPGKMEFIQP